MKECSLGAPGADYDCRFCRVPVHRGGDRCPCSTFRQAVCQYASICGPCAAALDCLTDEATRFGTVHAAIVREATFTFAHSDD